MSSKSMAAVPGSGLSAIVSADRDGRISAWNEAAEQVLGYSAADAIGQSLDLIIPVEERSDHWHGFRRAMTKGLLNYRPDHVLDVEGLRRDGTRVKLDVSLAGIHDQAGHLVGVTAIIREA